jgi:regulator of replication initiation timing
MTPADMLEWTASISVAACVLLGVAMGGTSVRTLYVARAASWALVAYALISVMLLFAPKASKLTIEFKDLKAHISKLESENQRLLAERDSQKTRIASLSQIAKQQHIMNAEQWLTILQKTKDRNASILTLPGAPDFKLQVTDADRAVFRPVAEKLNTSPEALSQALAAGGLTVLKSPSNDELIGQPLDRLWIGVATPQTQPEKK